MIEIPIIAPPRSHRELVRVTRLEDHDYPWRHPQPETIARERGERDRFMEQSSDPVEHCHDWGGNWRWDKYRDSLGWRPQTEMWRTLLWFSDGTIGLIRDHRLDDVLDFHEAQLR